MAPLSILGLVPHLRLGVKAVATFRGVEVRVGVADGRAREADDPPDDGRARVGRHPEDEFADEVVALLDPVERFEAVVPGQKVVDEVGRLAEVVGRAVREDDVLDPEFDELVVVFERVAVDVLVVAQFAELLDRDVEFGRADARDRQVGHVVADGAVLERADVVFRPEDALLHRLGRLVRGGQPLHPFQGLEGALALADPLERPAVDLAEVDRPALDAGALDLTSGTLDAAGLVGFEFRPAVGTLVVRERVAAAVGAVPAEGVVPAVLALASADRNLDLAGRIAHPGGVPGGLAHVALGAAGLPDRKERVDRRREVAPFRLLGPAHPVADPGGGAFPHREGRDLLDRPHRVLAAVPRAGVRGERVPPAGQLLGEPHRRDERAPLGDRERLRGLAVFDQQRLERLADSGRPREFQFTCTNLAVLDGVGERLESLDCEVVPEVGVAGVQRGVVLAGPFERLLGRG